MHFHGFDLNLLTALDALLEERSVTRAAERLHVTQPAMSNALQRIRAAFGDPILERSGRELRLTPFAVTLIGPVQLLLKSAAKILQDAVTFEPATATRTFRIAMSDYCAMVFLPVIVAKVHKEAPAIHCAVEPLNERSYERLCSREIDFCISAQDILLVDLSADDTLLSRADLFRDRFVSATSSEHKAARDGLTPELFLSSRHVAYRSGAGCRSMAEQAGRTLGLGLEYTVTTPTLGAMPIVIRGTDLIATFPSRMAKQLWPGVHIFDCPVPIPDLVETLFWHPLAETDLGHEWMQSLLLRCAAELTDGSDI